MLPRFTRTSMVKLATTFIAATSTISVRMMNIITRSTCRAPTKRALSACQSDDLEVVAVQGLADGVGDLGRQVGVGQIEIDRAHGAMVVFEVVLQHLQWHEDQRIVELIALGQEAREHLVVGIARRDRALLVEPLGRDA